jgi:uncharacterized protein (TIGR02300 family)
VAKPDLGTKRVCQSCGAKFYDLSKDPITCPKCGAVYEIVVPVTRGGRPAAAAAAAAAVAPVAAAEDVEARDDGAEVISLEDAEAESLGKKPKGGDPELETDDVEVEVEGDDEEDDTFLVTDDEEEGGDVSDIIGDGIDKEEEN